jgi:hypothetical protein
MGSKPVSVRAQASSATNASLVQTRGGQMIGGGRWKGKEVRIMREYCEIEIIKPDDDERLCEDTGQEETKIINRSKQSDIDENTNDG